MSTYDRQILPFKISNKDSIEIKNMLTTMYNIDPRHENIFDLKYTSIHSCANIALAHNNELYLNIYLYNEYNQKIVHQYDYKT